MNNSFFEAIRVLREGGVILYPTDTIWGLGCDATDSAAVERIFRIKARPEAKSLVLLASDLDMVAEYRAHLFRPVAYKFSPSFTTTFVLSDFTFEVMEPAPMCE